MTDKPFDPTKPVQTRDGRKARIVCTDFNSAAGKKLIVAITTGPEGYEMTGLRFPDGRSYQVSEKSSDLVNVPEVTTTVSNIYRDGSGRMWSDYQGYAKKEWPSQKYVGFIEWTLEDGEPVSCRFVPDKQGAQ